MEKKGPAEVHLWEWQRNCSIDVVDFTRRSKRPLMRDVDAMADSCHSAKLAFYYEQLAIEQNTLE